MTTTRRHTRPRNTFVPPIVAVVAWAASYVVCRGMADRPTSVAVRAALVATPAILLLWCVAAMIRAVGRLDELERRIHLEALAFAFPAGVALLMTGALAELAFPSLRTELTLAQTWPALAIGWVIGLTVARRRYR